VNDAGAFLSAYTRKALKPVQKRVDQSPAVDSGAGVDDHACGLIDRHDIVVFIEDDQRDRFGSGV
jgi:hypothetical protein